LTDHGLADVFRKLLSEHSALLSSNPMSGRAQEFKEFLDGFATAYDAASRAEAAEAKEDRQAFETFFQAYRNAQAQRRTAQQDKADDFNLLDVMGLTKKENTHSDILAWLLDHDIDRLGTHAQGGDGFRLFSEAVGLANELGECADCDYRVSRESASDESRIDIEVAHRGSFVIHIENKIWAGEGVDQTEREWRDLERRAKELECPKYFAFFLTPRGTKAKNGNFRPISWRKIAAVFEQFAANIRSRATVEEGALAVSLFATHYAGVLRRHIVLETNDREKASAQESI
jgi:hypothetical protein